MLGYQGLTDATVVAEREYEIVNGVPKEKEMAGARHGGIGTRLIVRLGAHVEANRLGGVYGPDTMFQIGANDRLPDVAFVAAARIPATGEPEGKWPLAPDLAVEIISTNDLFEQVLSKVREYFNAGVRQVWVISPEHRMVFLYDSPNDLVLLAEDGELVSEGLLPGFRCKVSELFQQPANATATQRSV
jgi:Uma2 family endonuclease